MAVTLREWLTRTGHTVHALPAREVRERGALSNFETDLRTADGTRPAIARVKAALL